MESKIQDNVYELNSNIASESRDEELYDGYLPMLALRGLLVYPDLVLHFDVGREKSVRALEKAMEKDEIILLVSQKHASVEEPEVSDLYHVGTVVRIKQMLKLPDKSVRVLVEGLHRARILSAHINDGCFVAKVEIAPDEDLEESVELEAKLRALMDVFEEYARISKKISPESVISVLEIEDPGRIADNIAALIPIKLAGKQEILETFDVERRLDILLRFLNRELEITSVEKRIHSQVKKQIEQNQKEYYLKEQLKAIQKELGEEEDDAQEIEELKEKIEKKKAPRAVKERLQAELKKLKKMPPYMAEYFVLRNYIDWLLDLPFHETSKDVLDINKAETILNEDHYGLLKVKERILEYLSIRKIKNDMQGPILCLVGPPGVGKTSLAKSVARSMNRKFVRMSLGGVRDEAEIRGHRKTYVGAMPGRIIQGMKSAGTSNPVFLLDEIDKLNSDFKGDPASALLEVLDPAQNNTFSDNYVEVPYDLSKVLFITTANTTHTIPRPLLDRMEVITLSGYTEEEKVQIALKYLVPKQLKEHGLEASQVNLSEGTVREIIRYYTRESGVRELERQIAAVIRKAVRRIVQKDAKSVRITSQNLENFLGMKKYKFGIQEETDLVGLAMGLAWTEVGGDVLPIEVSVFPGKGHLNITGQLGDVMQESAKAALSYVRSIAVEFGVKEDFFYQTDIHIHVPEGAIPKDGPSAGITMATALMSALTNRPVRNDVAMTGEITLIGRVLPIGGLKEKTLAAHRAGITHIIIPDENRKDLEEIPQNVKRKLTFHPVKTVKEVFEIALKEEKA